MAASTDDRLRALRKELAAQVTGRAVPTAADAPLKILDNSPSRGSVASTSSAHAVDQGLDVSAVSAHLAGQPALLRSILALDGSQRAAVTTQGTATLVRAPVGSGKTTVLAHRVLWLHHALGVPLVRIAALTFTQAAAQELVGRVEALVRDPGPQDGFRWFGTFHGVARAALTRHHASTGFGLCDEARGRSVLAAVAADMHFGKRQLAGAWDDLALLRRGATDGWPPDRRMRTEILLRAYRAALSDQHLLDFDGLLESCTTWAATAADADLPRWLVVDELQDCNELELRCLSALRRTDTGLFAVGDPDQAIYGWRGGRGDVFDYLARSWPAEVLALRSNYRSTPEIGRAADAIIGRAANARVHHVRPLAQPIAVRRHVHTQMEGLYLAERLCALHAAGTPWPRLAVLARTREQLTALRTVLADAGVPCAATGRVEAWSDRPAAQWLLQILAAADGTSEVAALALRSALAARPFGVGSLSVWPMSALRKAVAANPNVRAVVACAATARVAGASRWLSAVADLDIAVDHGDELAAAHAGVHLDLAAHLHPSHRDHQRFVDHAQRALIQVAQLRAVTKLSWSAAAALVLADRPAPDHADAKAEGVALHTFHAAKGLEFDHVFISGCNQGVVPLAKAFADRAQWAEERRLLYVAMTRARDTLEISWHAQPPVRGGMAMPSEWLLALPEEVTHWVDEAAHETPATIVKAPPLTQALTEVSSPSERAWPLGTTVRHSKYGTGVVARCDDAQVHVAFGKLGEKSFSLLLCPLERA